MADSDWEDLKTTGLFVLFLFVIFIVLFRPWMVQYLSPMTWPGLLCPGNWEPPCGTEQHDIHSWPQQQRPQQQWAPPRNTSFYSPDSARIKKALDTPVVLARAITLRDILVNSIRDETQRTAFESSLVVFETAPDEDVLNELLWLLPNAGDRIRMGTVVRPICRDSEDRALASACIRSALSAEVISSGMSVRDILLYSVAENERGALQTQLDGLIENPTPDNAREVRSLLPRWTHALFDDKCGVPLDRSFYRKHGSFLRFREDLDSAGNGVGPGTQ